MQKKYILAVLVLLLSCSKESVSETPIDPVIEDPTTTPPKPTSFDRGGLLTNWTDNIILPALNNFNEELLRLDIAVQAFTSNLTLDNLSALKAQWLTTYKAWQHIEMFNIGKAEEIYFMNKMNIYPVNIERLENNITTGQYDLSNPNNFSSQGFPALDYMLFGLGNSDVAVLERYTSDSHYGNYLSDVVEVMVSNTSSIQEAWSNDAEAFKASTENTATSSLNKLTNDFIYYYEKGLRTNKIGIPAGVFSGSPLPGNVEAYYAKTHSKVLALEALQAVKNFYVGNTFGTTNSGESFKTYLNYLNSTKNGEDLSALIESKLESAQLKLEGLNDDFANQIETDNNALLLAFDALQEVVILLKVDMLQALSVNVDYADADGD